MRLSAAAVLAPLTVALAYFGGWPWLLLVTLVGIGLFLEWAAIVGAMRVSALLPGILGLVVAGILVGSGRLEWAFAVIVLTGAAVTALSSSRRGWMLSGLAYAAVALLATLLLRRDEVLGFSAIMFVLLLVWATDTGGYVVGRTVGGAKLWPRVSPKKTWSGAAGGFAGALIVAAGFVAAGQGRMVPLLVIAGTLSVFSQCGDLFESAVKRHFGVKDSGRLIPGHGGLLDRLDGFVAAVMIAAIIGLIRGGSDGAGRGLMVW